MSSIRPLPTSALGRTEIVVGVDGSAHSGAAVEWAAAEAAWRGLPLVLVSVSHWPADTAPAHGADLGSHGRLAALGDELRRAHPELLDVRQEVLPGLPGPALVARAAHAAMLVLGAPKATRAGRAPAGSAVVHCSGHATCPVVVVPVGSAVPARVG